MHKSLLAGIFLMGFGLAAASPAHADEWSKKYSVSGKPSVRVETDDGDIEISPRRRERSQRARGYVGHED
jgi:hypothetical protein